MNIQPIRTKKFLPPQDTLLTEIKKKISTIPERSVLAITSKVVSIDQGRCIPVEHTDKDTLAKEEAEWYLPRDVVPGGHILHTITENTLIGSSGIDASNANNYYILWPEELSKTVKKYHTELSLAYNVKKFGVLIVDSRSMPLRRGVVGVSIASFGFHKLNDRRGVRDLFGKEIHFSQVNVPDALASAAVVVMGETDEQTPLALLTELPFVMFGDDDKKDEPFSEYIVSREEDIYKPFLDQDWQKGGKGGTKST